MIKKLRKALGDIRDQKHKHFDDLEKIINRIRREHEHLFPALRVGKDGSRFVYDFGVPELQPISLEKEHRGRDCLPHKYAKRAIQGIEDVLDYIEANTVEAEEAEREGEAENEPTTGTEEATGALPESELSDRDSTE